MTARNKVAVGYVRVSKHDTTKDVSVAVQDAAIREWCDRTGYRLLGVFIDEGKSGGRTPEKRDSCRAALEMVRANGGLLVVYRSDRLSRDVEDRARLRKTVPIQSVTDNDEDTPEGNFSHHIKAAVAQYHREISGKTTRAALRKLKAEGRVYSRIIPFGWKASADGKRLLVVSAEQKAIAYMRGCRKRGNSLRAIAAKLDARGIAPRGTGKWNAQTVSNILKRRAVR